MEGALVSAPRRSAQPYSGLQWNEKRSIIDHLFLNESKSVKQIVQILAQQYGFYVNESMVTSRLDKWKLRKNFTKKAAQEHFQRRGHAGKVRIRSQEDMDRFISSASRHGIRAPSSDIVAPCGIVRHLQSPEVYYLRDKMITSIIHYINGEFDSATWKADFVPMAIVTDHLAGATGAIPASMKLMTTLAIATCCYCNGREFWARVLFRASRVDVRACIYDRPLLGLPAMLFVLYTSKLWPNAESEALLELLLRLTEPFTGLHPIKRIAEQVAQMDRAAYELVFWRSLFSQAVCCFANGLRARVGPPGDLAYALLQRVNWVSKDAVPPPRWVDPVARRLADPSHFDSGINVECAIAEAIEFQGLAELERLQAALEQQRQASQTPRVCEMLADRLASLERPIKRKRCTDCFAADDRSGYVHHLSQFLDHPEPVLYAGISPYMHDLLVGWCGIIDWGDTPFLRSVEQRIQEMVKELNTVMAHENAQQREMQAGAADATSLRDDTSIRQD